MEKKITLPLTEELAKTLKAGDSVYVTGTIYTSRDAGHKRMCEALERGEELPFDPTDATIYYVGPTPAKPGQVIGSAGPTTSGRMDAYAPTMMSVGARGMIGKGARLPEVVEAMKKYSGVYFGAIGGAGALLAKCIKRAELIAYEDLGAEALRKLYVEDMPLVVIIDSEGNNLYELGREEYLKKQKLQQAISKKNNVTFKSPTTGRTLDVPLETDYARGELKEQEIIIKGTIRCKCSDGIIRGETIYLYQPILRTSKGKRVGPIITNGALNADAPYQANYDGDQFVAHIPKREVVSQLNFDFIRGSKNHQNPEIRGYMDIEVPKDENGNYIPVDFTDPKELQEFKVVCSIMFFMSCYIFFEFL